MCISKGGKYGLIRTKNRHVGSAVNITVTYSLYELMGITILVFYFLKNLKLEN